MTPGPVRARKKTAPRQGRTVIRKKPWTVRGITGRTFPGDPFLFGRAALLRRARQRHTAQGSRQPRGTAPSRAALPVPPRPDRQCPPVTASAFPDLPREYPQTGPGTAGLYETRRPSFFSCQYCLKQKDEKGCFNILPGMGKRGAVFHRSPMDAESLPEI